MLVVMWMGKTVRVLNGYGDGTRRSRTVDISWPSLQLLGKMRCPEASQALFWLLSHPASWRCHAQGASAPRHSARHDSA